MKKLIVMFSVCAFAIAAKVNAQVVIMEDVIVSSVKLNEGSNSVPVPNGRGTIKLVKRGNSFTNVVFVDAAGKTTRLQGTQAGTNGAPQPSCKYPLPDACYGGPQNIGLCICKPTDLTTGNDYNIALLLPAVQKVREAAVRH